MKLHFVFTRIYILSGPPECGKSTFAGLISNADVLDNLHAGQRNLKKNVERAVKDYFFAPTQKYIIKKNTLANNDRILLFITNNDKSVEKIKKYINDILDTIRKEQSV